MTADNKYDEWYVVHKYWIFLYLVQIEGFLIFESQEILLILSKNQYFLNLKVSL